MPFKWERRLLNKIWFYQQFCWSKKLQKNMLILAKVMLFTCYPQEILHTCTKALFWSHVGSQGSPARGTGCYYCRYHSWYWTSSKNIAVIRNFLWRMYNMGQFPQDGENGQNMAFWIFLKLYCDQTAWFFHLFFNCSGEILPVTV